MPCTLFQDVVRREMNRPPLSHWDLMINSAQVAPALGRRVFDKEEILNNSESSDDEDAKEKAGKKKVIESRYMNVFDKKNEESSLLDDCKGKVSSKLYQEVRIIQERPSEFGLWDKALDPVNVVKANQRQPIKIKHSPLTAFEEQLRHAIQEKTEEQDGQKLEDKGEKSTRKSLKDHSSTGKYLHENDLQWCKKFTKMSEGDIIKWFKRFRLISGPKGKLTKSELAQSYEKLFIGNGQAFADLLFEAYQFESPRDVLDFKDYLIIVEVSAATTHAEKLFWLSRILDLNRKGYVSMYKLKLAIGILDLLQDPIPEVHYNNVKEYIEDPNRTKPKPSKMKRSVEERLESLDRYLNPDYYGNVRLKEFRSIPPRYISASGF